jgi:hypothetical protein
MRESLGPEVPYLFLYAFILFVLAINIFSIFILYLKQVYMCDQWLVVDLTSSVNSTLGVL